MRKLTLKQAAAWCAGRVAPEFETVEFFGVNFDTRRLRAGELFVAVLGVRDGHDFIPNAMEQGAAAVLASRPIDQRIPAIYVEDTVAAMQAIAKGYRETLKLKCVGITGSVGKTTTKEMIAAVLETTYRTVKTAENFNNGMGLPVTVLGIAPDTEAAVLEMGMNHFGEISRLTAIAQPDLAVITNVGTMHIENLGSRQGILQAKLEILEGLRPQGQCLFGEGDLLTPAAEACGAQSFGLCSDSAFHAEEVLENGQRFTAVTPMGRFPVELPVTGEHNVRNAMAAIAVGLKLGVSVESIQTALKNFHNTGMRQRIYRAGGVTVIEDCYNAGPESMAAALKVLSDRPGRRIAVLGGMLELGDFAPQMHEEVGSLAAACAHQLYAYGSNSEYYVSGAKAAGLREAYCFHSHEALAAALSTALRAGDTILVKGSRGMRMERVLQLLNFSISEDTQHG